MGESGDETARGWELRRWEADEEEHSQGVEEHSQGVACAGGVGGMDGAGRVGGRGGHQSRNTSTTGHHKQRWSHNKDVPHSLEEALCFANHLFIAPV